MKFSLEPNQPNTIHSYSTGQISVAGEVYTQPLVISASGIQPDWPPRTLEQITVRHILDLLSLKPEVVILGTGATLRFPSAEIAHCLVNQRVGMEVMDTASACRTFNVLLGEDRRVVAALLMIGE